MLIPVTPSVQLGSTTTTLSLAGVATSIIFVETKVFFIMFVDKIMFVATNLWRDKHTFVATKDVFCRVKHLLVASAANDTTRGHCQSCLY